MRRFKLTIVVETTDDMDKSDFVLMDDDAIDGYTLSRWNDNGDVTTNFKMTSAEIDCIEEI